MKRICLLIMKPPQSSEDAERMCGLAMRARMEEKEVAVYLLGNGVYCSKSGQKGSMGGSLRAALKQGVTIRAGEADLMARGITTEQVEPGVEILPDLEDTFVEDIMEKADRVVTW